MIPRIFYEGALSVGQEVTLGPEASGHVLRVLRRQEGEPVCVFNGLGGEYEAILVGTQKNRATLVVGDYRDRNVELPVPVSLGQAISRGDRMDYAVQKAVECGVHAIYPLLTTRCSVSLDAGRAQKRQAHWQAVAVSAAEQSGRCIVPRVALPLSLEAWVQQSVADVQCYCDPAGAPDALSRIVTAQSIAVVVGPEGGFSPEECRALSASSVMPLSLGPRVLRTETAPIVALTRIAHVLG